MRLAAASIVAMTAAAMLSACAPYTTPVDPEIATERAATGAVLGATLGAGLGATFAIDPALGAVIGAETGAGLGAAAGVMTSPPPPTYTPVAVPADAVGPHFYDTWPPGYHAPPTNPETQPPRAG
ncbi:MAG TPA: hypothetical protein VG308_13390 [Stellaceae bacterium]|jgi:hypothetical protein|nr:hypothetical protein [Stellaceae bacterium]